MTDSKLLPLDDRMKKYEARSDSVIDTTRAVVIRLDGKRFSRFTKGFDRFDADLNACFEQTCLELLEEFHGCQFIYTQSDEISMFFPSRKKVEEDKEEWKTGIDFSGRIQKLVSILCSTASLKFNRNLQRLLQASGRYELSTKRVGKGIFDARVFNTDPLPGYPTPTELTEDWERGNVELCNNVIFRQRDFIRNSRMRFASQYNSKNSLHGVKSDDAIAQALEKHGADYTALPDWAKFGTLFIRGIESKQKFYRASRVFRFSDLAELVIVKRDPGSIPESFQLVSRRDNSIAKDQILEDLALLQYACMIFLFAVVGLFLYKGEYLNAFLLSLGTCVLAKIFYNEYQREQKRT